MFLKQVFKWLFFLPAFMFYLWFVHVTLFLRSLHALTFVERLSAVDTEQFVFSKDCECNSKDHHLLFDGGYLFHSEGRWLLYKTKKPLTLTLSV